MEWNGGMQGMQGIQGTRTYRQRHIILAGQQQTLRKHSSTLGSLTGPLSAGRQMRMTTVSDQGDLVVLADPRRYGVAITDLPVEAGIGLSDDGRDSRVAILHEFTHGIHVAGLEPGLLDVLGVLVRDDPVELVAVPQRVLDQVLVLADPDVDAFLFDELGGQRISSEVVALEEGPEARVPRRFGFIVESEHEFSSA
ncbi:hypothetical protein LTR92_005434 [Exophiala xenobiotica]|nr:hypothetical protein LTR92_005434 [Exophiala xenobiotica]